MCIPLLLAVNTGISNLVYFPQPICSNSCVAKLQRVAMVTTLISDNEKHYSSSISASAN